MKKRICWVGDGWKGRWQVLKMGNCLGREGEEEDLEGLIPQDPSGDSIGF